MIVEYINGAALVQAWHHEGKYFNKIYSFIQKNIWKRKLATTKEKIKKLDMTCELVDDFISAYDSTSMNIELDGFETLSAKIINTCKKPPGSRHISYRLRF